MLVTSRPGRGETSPKSLLKLTSLLITTGLVNVLAPFVVVKACTNIVVTPGASANGSMIFGYSSDDHKSYGQLYHYPATSNNPPGATVDVYEWETGNFLGRIPQPKETYNVVGNCNEYNVCIGETTFGGPPDLVTPHPNSIIDYGSLIYLGLQRSKTSKEAVQVMTELAETYGYHSEGESFSVVDPNEAYLLEMISKGQHEVGALWVSCLVPDGTMVVHANHARITTFLDNDTCTYSKDIVDFALQLGLYKESSLPSDYEENANATTANGTRRLLKEDEGRKDTVDHSKFSFSDTYSPKQPYELRYTDARVWDVYRAFFNTEYGRQAFDDLYLKHVLGQEDVKTSHSNLLPIWFTPARKLTLKDIRVRMSSHYENTPLEYGHDVAGGMFDMPYKPRPNNWLYSPAEGVPPQMYVNERPIATEKTGFNFIVEIKPLMTADAVSSNGIVVPATGANGKPSSAVAHPRLQTVMWYATDDCSTAPRIPVFPSSRRVSSHYAGKGSQQGHRVPIMEFDMSTSFWIQNLVSNLAYYRWSDIYPVLKAKLDDVQSSFEERVETLQRQVTDRIMKEGVENAKAAIEMFQWFPYHLPHLAHPHHGDATQTATAGNSNNNKELEKTLETLNKDVIDMLSDFTHDVGNDMHQEWVDYFGYLFVRYRDFVIMEVDPTDKGCGCHSHEIGLEPKWQKRIVEERGDHFRVSYDVSTLSELDKYYADEDETEEDDTAEQQQLGNNATIVSAKETDTKENNTATNNASAVANDKEELASVSPKTHTRKMSSSLMTKLFSSRPLSKSMWSWFLGN